MRYFSLSAILLASSLICGVNASGQTYILEKSTISAGGTIDASSPTNKSSSTVGQSASGEASSPEYQVGVGYWTGTATCACPCHGDPRCDGVKVDVLDVGETIGVAFRGAPSVCDGACPAERTDVDCDGDTDVIDVVKMIKVAFQGFNISTEFCNPCQTPPPPGSECN